MLVTRCDRAHAGEDLCRSRPNLVGAVAELAKIVVAPRPYRAAGLDRERMLEAGGGRLDAEQHTRGHRAVGGAAVAELAVVVRAPRPQRAVAPDGQRVIDPAHRLAHTGEDLNRGGLVDRAPL